MIALAVRYWKPIVASVSVIVALLSGISLGRHYFPRLVIQPIDREILRVIQVPGTVVERTVTVPGPVLRVPQIITLERDRVVFVTKPVALPPAQLEEARKQALRRFSLLMEIPANQLIPCPSPRLVAGGMSCAESIRFSAEILEPAVGVFVPIVLPGQIAQPIELRVDVRPDMVQPIEAGWRWSFGPTAGLIASGGTIRAAAGLMVRATRGPWEAEVRGGREWGLGAPAGYWGTAFVTYRFGP